MAGTASERGGKLTSPGKNMKPMFDGTFKEAGAHPDTYTLEHENGARAIVDTKTATCISWIDQNGVQVIDGAKGTAHMFPTSSAPLDGHFVPEERAKKVSFDRMIFKCTDGKGCADLEYRVDVTMRENCLEYDVVIKNAAAEAKSVSMAIFPHISAAAAAKRAAIVKMTGETNLFSPYSLFKHRSPPLSSFDIKNHNSPPSLTPSALPPLSHSFPPHFILHLGYTEKAADSVKTGTWSVPVGKFKETAFYMKIDSTKK